jgi:thiol:disulfide interchange protein DsbD
MTYTKQLPNIAAHLLRLTALIVTLMLTVVPLAQAQGFFDGRSDPLPVDEAFELNVVDHEDGTRVLNWTIADGYYMYRDYLSAQTEAGVEVSMMTPPGIRKDDPNFGSVEIYHDSLQADMAATSGSVTVTYQGCQDEGICYPPVSRTLAPLGAGTTVSADSSVSETPDSRTEPKESDLTLSQDKGVIEGLQARGGITFVLAGFFFFGMLLAFTPCMFPMFPILAGLLAGQSNMTAQRGFTISGVYVLAMALAFGLLGVAAAWSGQNLQVALQSPVAIYAAAAIFVVIALSMFGLFEIQLPAAWTQRLSRVGTSSRGTLGGAATLGFTSALIMGPCVTAPLAGALLYIAGTGDVTLGAAALFFLGLGQGIPLLLVGTLGSQILPKAGAWMTSVKYAFGFIFLGMALWLVGRIAPGPEVLLLWSVLLIGAGVFAGAMDMLSGDAGPVRRVVKTGAVFSVMAGGVMLVGAASGASDPSHPFSTFQGASGSDLTQTDGVAFVEVTSKDALEAALADGQQQPTLIYVTADWCVTCRVIEREVWDDPAVKDALGNANVIAADVSNFDAGSQAMLDTLGAVGPPTMVFLDRDQTEKPNTRIVGETTAEHFLKSFGTVR